VTGWVNSTRSKRLPGNWRRTIRPRILARDHHLCRIRLPGCTHDATDVDHIGDPDDHSDANLQAACSWCNQQKNLLTRPKPPSTQRPAVKHPGLR
jgi:hypothetical protein